MCMLIGFLFTFILFPYIYRASKARKEIEKRAFLTTTYNDLNFLSIKKQKKCCDYPSTTYGA